MSWEAIATFLISPLKIRHSAIREEQGLRPGGFGILVTRNIIDELIYSEKGNEVLLIKYVLPEL